MTDIPADAVIVPGGITTREDAQKLVNALVAHFNLPVTTAEQLNADDARDEALAEQTDTALIGPKATTPDA